MKPTRDKVNDESDKPRKKAEPHQYYLPLKDVEEIEKLRARYQRLALEKSDKPVDIAKSEIVRAGIHALSKLNDPQFFKCLENLEVLKEGRPPKQKDEEK